MTDSEYRSHKAISNSSLGELLAKITGRSTMKAKPETLQFGTTFHQICLQPELPVDWSIHHVTERYKMMQMQENLFRFMNDFGLVLIEPEQAQFWTDWDTDLQCKAKVDAKMASYLDGKYIVDLKTTSAKSSQEFVNCFESYGYDRQAAFYADGHDCSVPDHSDPLNELLYVSNRVLFIAVQKCKPYNVFSVDMSKQRSMIDMGRKKYKRLMKQAAIELANPGGWRPSEWSRKEA